MGESGGARMEASPDPRSGAIAETEVARGETSSTSPALWREVETISTSPGAAAVWKRVMSVSMHGSDFSAYYTGESIGKQILELIQLAVPTL